MIDFDLYLVTDPDVPELVARTVAALEAVPRGRVAVQVRGKRLDARELLELARALRGPTLAAGAKLLVNGRADVARIAAADGVHLPERSFTAREARLVLGEHAVVGVSCHDARGLTDAEEGGASFVTLGPFDDSPGKGAPIARARFIDLASGCSLPVLALGGVFPENVTDALAAGAHGVAVIRSLYATADSAAAARELVTALDSARRAKQ